MGLSDSPIMKIISINIKLVIGFFDMAYKNYWLFYLILGLIMFAFIIIVWN